MKIAMLTSSFYPTLGGLQDHVRNLRNELTKKGHDVNIIVARKWLIPSARSSVSEWITAYFVGVPYTLRELLSITSKQGLHVLHIHGFLEPYVFCIPFLRLLSRQTRLVVTVHAVFSPTAKFRQIIFGLASRIVSIMSMNLADKVIVLTPQYMDLLASFGVLRGKLTVIPGFLNAGKFDALSKATCARLFLQEFPRVRRGRCKLLCVGRIDKQKNLGTLIRALEIVVRYCPETILIMVGPDAGDLDYVKRTIQRCGLQDKVMIAGQVTDQLLYGAYCVSDVFVMPSFAEGFPHVIAEAGLAGLPIISGKWPGADFQILNRVSGIIVENNSATEFGEAIMRLISDEAKRHEMGKAARQRSLLFASNKQVDSVLKAYGVNNVTKQGQEVQVQDQVRAPDDSYTEAMVEAALRDARPDIRTEGLSVGYRQNT